jgi:hypothetical protein
MQALPEFKRVVTGHDQHGQAIAARNGATNVLPLSLVPGTVSHRNLADMLFQGISAYGAAICAVEMNHVCSRENQSDGEVR